MIIPVTQLGRSQATSWLRMYDTEEHWLDWAFSISLDRPVRPCSQAPAGTSRPLQGLKSVVAEPHSMPVQQEPPD